MSFLANLRYGQYLVTGKRYAEARKPLEIAVCYRRYPEAVQLLAFDFERMGEPESALAALNAGLLVFANNPDLAGMRARLLADHPRLRDSRACSPLPPLDDPRPDVRRLRAALARNPKDEDALFLLSGVYSERAAMYFRRLEELAPDSVRVLQIKGLNAEDAEDYAAAEAYYRQAVQKQPRLPGVHYALGHVLRRLGRDAEAIQEMRAELELDPYHYLAYFELGASTLQKGDLQAALPILEKCARLRPTFAEAKVELAKSYLQLKRAPEAITLLESVTARFPDHPAAHYLLARAYIMSGSPEKGREEMALHQKVQQKQTMRRRGFDDRRKDQPTDTK